MTKEQGTEINEGEVIPALQVPVGAIAVITNNVARMELMVSQVLERDVDFGRSPGVPTPYLWDPGAGKIMAGYNVYPKHEIIHQHESPNGALTIVIETSLIARETGKVVGTGVGAASGLEVKNKYRWVADPAEYGIDKAGLKAERRENRMMYRIINPEFGEQWHNLIKSAAKRSEIDAVQSLPGVLSALKKLAHGDINGDVSLTGFWTAVKGMGYSESTAYTALGIKSLKTDWQGKGRLLSEALEILAKKASQLSSPPTQENKAPGPAPMQDGPQPTPADARRAQVDADELFGAEARESAAKSAPISVKAEATVIAQTAPASSANPPLALAMPPIQNWGQMAQEIWKLGIKVSDVLRGGGVKSWDEFKTFEQAWDIALALKAEGEKG